MLKFIDKLTKRLEKKKDELEDLLEKGKRMEANDFFIYSKKNHPIFYIFCNIMVIINRTMDTALANVRFIFKKFKKEVC